MKTNPAAPSRVLAVAIATLWVWLLIGAGLNGAQLSDNLEHFIWSQSFEWGYWKHPPLPTWMVYGLNHAWGPSAVWTYVLAGVCMAATLLATYKITRHLFGPHAASVAAILMTLHLGLTRGAQLYNHNTVMLTAISLTAWVALVAAHRRRTGLWLLVGVLAGLSLLTKYQSAFPLLGILLAIGCSPDGRRHAAGVLLAITVAVGVVSPHLIWLIDAPYTPLQYAMKYVGDDPAFSHRWIKLGSFVTGQIIYYLPLMGFMMLALLDQKRRPQATKSEPCTPLNQLQKAWMMGLLVFPLALMALFALGMGVQVQRAWGLQASQFLPVFLAPWVLHKWDLFKPFHVWSWVGLQLLALSVWVAQNLAWVIHSTPDVALRELPAKTFAEQARSFWADHTTCPLRYLSGDSAMAAMISIYSGRHLPVLEDGDPAKSPWIDLADMRRSGHLAVTVESHHEPQADAMAIPLVYRNPRSAANPRHRELVIRWVPPEDCVPITPPNA